jgi:hypothetical protein
LLPVVLVVLVVRANSQKQLANALFQHLRQEQIPHQQVDSLAFIRLTPVITEFFLIPSLLVQSQNRHPLRDIALHQINDVMAVAVLVAVAVHKVARKVYCNMEQASLALHQNFLVTARIRDKILRIV